MGKVTNHKHGDINVPVLLGLDAGVVRVLQLTAEPESRAVCVRPLVIGLKKSEGFIEITAFLSYLARTVHV